MYYKLRKWDYNEHAYNDYYVISTKKIKTYSNDMEEIINCCQCLKEMKYGEGYTSLEVHTEMGFGYCVCKDCYEKEYERKLKHDKQDI